MHGDIERLFEKDFRKLRRGEILIVCGDFGYIFDNSKKEKPESNRQNPVLVLILTILIL